MAIIIGIDVGGSTTKIVGFRDGELLEPMLVKATDPVASVYGAFGKFTSERGIDIPSVERVMITGVGSTYITGDIYGIPTVHVDEFAAIGRGGLYLSALEEAIIVSMGTGTALVYAKQKRAEYLGGTGVGGGTMIGLSKALLHMQDPGQISELAQNGDLENIDLKIHDITSKNIIPTLSAQATASNFGKVSEIATNGDYALGIINMICETIGMMAVFAARAKKITSFVLTGNLSTLEQAPRLYSGMGVMFGMDFIIPRNIEYATVIGAALLYFDKTAKEGKK